MELILFPDADVLVGEYLIAGLALQGETVHVETQESAEHREYIRVRSTGGGQAALTLDDAQLTIECFADDNETRAMHLATLTRAIVQYMGRDNKSGVLAILGDARRRLPHPSGLAPSPSADSPH
jgi:hypothetical protein